jgi:hypothetical protein
MKFTYLRHAKSLLFIICSHRCHGLVELDTVQSVTLQTFRRKLLTPYSGQKRVQLECRGVRKRGMIGLRRNKKPGQLQPGVCRLENRIDFC